jgi:protein-L-isoaspartate(D-aspartate) O-methyltransferase
MTMQIEGVGMTSRRTRERLIQRLAEKGIRDQRVLQAMLNVPRHLFIDEALAHRAYEDTALPIGFGQTISQPWVVARMTEAAIAEPVTRVLEIGTGCGYQTAILAALISEVYSIERIEHLYLRARDKLRELNVRNVRLRYGDGFAGWPQFAPFDLIMLTAAPPALPEELLKQLRDGGRMVAPIGGGSGQELQLITRQGNQFMQSVLDRVIFVPMLGGVSG